MNKIEFEGISAFHPGYYLSDLINEMEITQTDFAKQLGISTKVLGDILYGKVSISANIANNLSLIFGTSMELWLNLQRRYDQKFIDIKLIQEERNT